MRTIQKNIRVSPDVDEWMKKHPLSDNSLVNYGLHLLMQMEANATQPLIVHVNNIPTPEQVKQILPF